MARNHRAGKAVKARREIHVQFNRHLGYRTNTPYYVPSTSSIGTRLHPQSAVDVSELLTLQDGTRTTTSRLWDDFIAS
jgi:hypothetical protein